MTTGPGGVVLRLELREADGAGPAPARPAVQTFTLRADRLALDQGGLSFWRGRELVFQCPAAALAAIDFMSPAESPAAKSASAYPGAGAAPDHQPRAHEPHRDAHHDLASANTRWTPEDERRLRELHQAGIPLDAIARALGRQRGAVRARLARLRSGTGSDSGPGAAPR